MECLVFVVGLLTGDGKQHSNILENVGMLFSKGVENREK